MKIMTILGTRPEIIRLSLIIPKLDVLSQHTLLYTGQNFDPRLKDIFFDELKVRQPDIDLAIQADHVGDQIGRMISGIDAELRRVKPDRVLILGDTNSSLAAAIAAARLRVPTFHMEAGNRCYDDQVPEEVNRRIIDHAVDVNLPYTQRSRENLLREGLRPQRVITTGNPIAEVIDHFVGHIEASPVLSDLGLGVGGYFLATLHRAENVDDPERLRTFLLAFCRVAAETGRPVVFSVHPRTQARMSALGLPLGTQIKVHEPFGFFDFVLLETYAACVLSDSGTAQEECCILQTPSVTLRDSTERPEAIECGSTALSGCSGERIVDLVTATMVRTAMREDEWTVPPEYTNLHVSDTVCRVLLSHHEGLCPTG
jgi:UDP-N-acetylglucosamine 2-epimerase (non-hydrolysing)